MVDLSALPLLLATEDWPAAERLLRRAAAGPTATASVFFNLAKVLEKQDQHAERESWLNKALELDPGYAKAWFELGRLRMDAGALAQAEQAFGQAAAHAPEDLEAWRMLLRLRLRLGLWADARDALAALPSDAETRAAASRLARATDDTQARSCTPVRPGG